MARWLTIGVSYGCDDDATDFTRSVAALDGHAQHGRLILAVNKAPGSDPVAIARQLDGLPNVHVRAAPCNLGYFGAAAWALRWYTERWLLPDWIVVSNCDVTFPSASLFTDLLAGYSDHREAPAVVGPFIALETPRRAGRGKSQNPYMIFRPRRKSILLFRAITTSPPCYSLYQRASLERVTEVLSWARNALGRSCASDPSMKASDAYALFGAFLIFHSSYFEAGGTLDYEPFLYGEELFVAETLRLLDLRARYDPALRVEHREHASTGGLSPYQQRRFSREALDFIVDNYFRTA
ncbi:MAG: glycosyltransferase family 2 protein [Mycobacteriales bacterium]